jgi:hypothetical protein
MGTVRIALLALAFVIAGISAGKAEIIKTGSLQASSDGIAVTVRWVSDDETNVAAYEIQRSVPNGTFQPIATITPKGPSLYEFVDHSAFMKATTLYQYRIQIISIRGDNPSPSTPVSVSHSVSGVRRTWGSIKSMFR